MPEKITYDSIALQVTDLQKSVFFWTNVIGLHTRSEQDNVVEIGTNETTLVTLKDGATSQWQNGYSGLYHVAIHVPTEKAFASILAHLIELSWPISPTDHIMSKAIYLLDPDGITIEITLETPERFSHYNMQGGLFQVIDVDGNVRGATEPLDIRSILSKVQENTLFKHLPDETRVGHVHLYVPDLQESYNFYQSLGFQDNLLSVPIGFADLSAGGVFKHRMAMNTWQSLGAPQASAGTAGMEHFTLRYTSKELFDEVIATKKLREKNELGYKITDPAGNTLYLNH